MANQIEGFIALLVILTVFVLVGTFGRLWILRHRPRTFSVNLSDGAFVLFSILIFISVGLAFDGVNSELHIERHYGGAEVDARLLTPKYLKVWLLKAAFLGYYWSLRETLGKKVQILLYCVSAYATVTYLGVISLQLGYCRPISRNWSTGPDQCISVQTVPGMIAQQGTNISSDILSIKFTNNEGIFIVLLIPLLTIGSFRSNYSLCRKELYALGFVFSVGIISIMASVVRFTQVYHVVMHSDNSILAIRRTLVWALVEKLFAFTAFCLPCLRVFYRKRHSAIYMDKGSGMLNDSISSRGS